VSAAGKGYDGAVPRRPFYRPPEHRSPGREPQRGLIGRLAVGGLLALAVAVPFTLLALLVLGNWPPLARLDASVANELNEFALAHAWLVNTLDVLAKVLDPWVFRALVLAVAVWLFRRGARRLALWAVVTTAIGGVLGGLLKVIVERARPSFDQPVAHANGFSFPSGHALNSFLCVGVLLLVFLPVLTTAGRVLAYSLGAFLVLLTGFDRVALGVHYVSDVVAGWIVALACLAGAAGAFEIWRREHGRPASPMHEGLDPEGTPEVVAPETPASDRTSPAARRHPASTTRE
jgi:membrane-associated phospholipid phosphatase